MNNVMK